MPLSKSNVDTFNAVHKPPQAPRDNTFDIIHGKKVADSFRPLEKIEAIDTHEYIQAQNARFDAFVKDEKAGQAFAKALDELMNFERETLPRKAGPYRFNQYDDGTMQQSVVRVRKGLRGKPRVLIDPNKFDPTGRTSVSKYYPSPNGKYVAFVLTKNGSDMEQLYVLNTKTGRWHAKKVDGHRIVSVKWSSSNRAFTYAIQSADFKRLMAKRHVIGRATKFDESLKYTGTPSAKKINSNKVDYTHYKLSYKDSPRGELLVYNRNAKGTKKKWTPLIKQDKRLKMVSVRKVRGGFLVKWLDDAASRITLHDYQGRKRATLPLPKNCHATLGNIFNGGQDMLINLHDYTSLSGTVYRYNFKPNTIRRHNPAIKKAYLKDLVVERHYAKSKDGTKVPMTIIRRMNVKLDGTAAAKLYGYGGFNSDQTPVLRHDAAQWVKDGGIFIQTNLRGGGEFGKDWHDGGRIKNKQNTFDDFIACAEYLIKNKFTSSERLCTRGGSNGGLLTLATMLQRPDLFGAVVSAVPVTDMFRFDRFTAGTGWKKDYGDIPNCKSHFNAAAAYSPLHNVKPNVKYPPTLVMTSDQDDRVVPLHSYKFVAAMNDINPGSLTLLRVARNQGHGAGRSRDQLIADMAAEHAFLVKTLGPIDQNEYKAALKASRNVAKNKKFQKSS